jgi:hypothetical protein
MRLAIPTKLLLRFLVGGTEETFCISVTGDKNIDDLEDIVVGRVPGSVKHKLMKVKGILSSIKTFNLLSCLVRSILIPVQSVLSLKSLLGVMLNF